MGVLAFYLFYIIIIAVAQNSLKMELILFITIISSSYFDRHFLFTV